ncbi:hypothetical protein B0H17DRAFT_1266727 [Mycena rosella]|uniref:F-box domain-containing protein n=1 Tax=Mycena rosella TaxID=1033263 RepID=A0AAD7DQS1_MYCRO|nr:hypothetical protein B0H17DRAFT_1266727 [Mycena rosella]
MPPELQLETYHTDLLSLSHVSKFWRSFVLQDRRWATWFKMIVNPVTNTSPREFLARFKVLDAIPARAIVTLCFSTKCAHCSKDTPNIFLPLLKRICDDCLHPKTHAVVSLTAALTGYDLSDKDVQGVVVLHWEETDAEKRKNPIMARAKLVTGSSLPLTHRTKTPRSAIEKHGGEDNLTAHLTAKKARALESYEKRLAEYNLADTERKRLKATGDLAGAAAVTWKDNKQLPKTRPRIPPLLKTPLAPAFYQDICILHTNFLALEDDHLIAHSLVKCRLCAIIAELHAHEDSSEPAYPDFMRPALLPAHEERQHYARRDNPCSRMLSDDEDEDFFGSCDTCLNHLAIVYKEEEDAEASQ